MIAEIDLLPDVESQKRLVPWLASAKHFETPEEIVAWAQSLPSELQSTGLVNALGSLADTEEPADLRFVQNQIEPIDDPKLRQSLVATVAASQLGDPYTSLEWFQSIPPEDRDIRAYQNLAASRAVADAPPEFVPTLENWTRDITDQETRDAVVLQIVSNVFDRSEGAFEKIAIPEDPEP